MEYDNILNYDDFKNYKNAFETICGKDNIEVKLYLKDIVIINFLNYDEIFCYNLDDFYYYDDLILKKIQKVLDF